MGPREECAVFGIHSDSDVFDRIYYGLYALQHRGQESSGIATFSDKINLYKGMGLFTEVFKGKYLSGNSGIGHNRYSTTGESGLQNAQPVMINYAEGSFALAHNGNLINSTELRTELERKGSVFTTSTDTEIISHLIAQEHLKTGNFIKGVENAMKLLRGSYSMVILRDGDVIAVRDSYGVRPLILGKSDNDYVVASESCALDALDMEIVRDVKPGEILVLGDSVESYQVGKSRTAHCMFEYVYFARPDSVLDGIEVYRVRENLGSILSKEKPVKVDIVTAIPDSGMSAAAGYVHESGIPYAESLMKNRYFGRTFILPDQEMRDKGVKIKLNPIRSNTDGKKLIVVDDSIVRGTTMRRIVSLLRDFGAKEVHVRISCPPIRHPCPYGIDMQTSTEFIANKKSVKEIGKEIGADSLAYNTIEGLIKAIGLPKKKLCMACLTGEYPIKEDQMRLEV